MKNKHTNFWREIEHGYHNDKPLYWTMLIFVGVFSIIAIALLINK